MFKKRRNEKDCPTKSPALDKAKVISEQYKQLSSCCDVLAEISKPGDGGHYSMYSGGWKISAYTVNSTGINIEEVYEHIHKLTIKRKYELEIELGKLEAERSA